MSNQEQQFLDQKRYFNQYMDADPLEQQQQMTYSEPEYYARPGEKLQPQRPRRRKRGPALLVIVLLVACLAFGGGVLSLIFGFSHHMHDKGIHDWNSKNELQQTFLVTGIPKLVIKNDSGSVNIRSDENVTDRVTVSPDQKNIVANYNPNTNTITIDTNGLGGVDLNIETPKTTDIQLNEGSGSVDIEGITGQMDVVDNSGSINVSLPENASFHLDASTKNGRANNDFGSDDVGSSPHPTLKLRSENGSIEVHKG